MAGEGGGPAGPVRGRAAAVAEVVPARPTAFLFASLAAGQVLNLAALSLFSACLGLAGFGRYAICLLDFAVFSNLAGFALPAASIAMAVRARFADRAFARALGARWWVSLAAAALYLAFEAAARDRGMLLAACALAPAVIANPGQLEWWSVARGKWSDLIVYRLLAGAVTLGLAGFLVRGHPSVPAAAGSLAAGLVSAFAYLLYRAVSGGRGWRLPWPGPRAPRVRWLWMRSLPLAIAGAFDFLFLPLGFYAFRALRGDSPFLGAYGAAYRVILAASLFASSLFLVMLPRLAARPGDASPSLRRAFDGMALGLALPLALAPFLARPLLRTLFPHAGWEAGTLEYAGWALSAMGLSTYLHLLRMPPLTQALAAGRAWSYCRRFLAAGAINAASVAAGAWLGPPERLPLWALAADLAFTGGWLLWLFRGGSAGWMRLGALLAGAVAYLAWAGRWA
jgi:O-antigen/teichoic acid export membrane protein